MYNIYNRYLFENSKTSIYIVSCINFPYIHILIMKWFEYSLILKVYMYNKCDIMYGLINLRI